MDYSELLLAAAVRDLAVSIKNSRSGAYWTSMADDPDRNQKRDAWNAAHPLIEFVPEALAWLEEVAAVIRTNEPSPR
jgi:hypothetical protein